MYQRVISVVAAFLIIGCVRPTGRYDTERNGVDLQISKKFRDAGFELIDYSFKKDTDYRGRLLFILNKPIDDAVIFVYDRNGNIFRNFAVGPGQLVQNKLQELKNPSDEYSIQMDDMDVQFIDQMIIGEK